MYLTRRQFLKAGGITFLALSPIGPGLFGSSSPGTSKNRLPLFTALPYIQPGPDGRLLPGQETVRIAWQTQERPASFVVRFGPGKTYGRSAAIERSSRPADASGDWDGRLNYVAVLEGLDLGRRYDYLVECNGAAIAEGYFTTRRPRGEKVRFVAFGDNGSGADAAKAIAFQAYEARPDFIMNTGDNVYDSGLDSEYGRFFFPVYNADVAEPQIGAPLLRSVPFYSVIANHDVPGRDSRGYPAADFDRFPDALAYFTALHLPLNGPGPAEPTPIQGDRRRLAAFAACAGSRFPRMANYSFDFGDLHFICLDSNLYVDPASAELQAWIEEDLASTDAPWKVAVYHHPAFNVGREHYREQQMRVLSPLFERHGVSLVLSGHEHNYQRTHPLSFSPAGPGGAVDRSSPHRLVPGRFAVDRAFDGELRTRPAGIIHVVTGAGGKHLYDQTQSSDPRAWRQPEDGDLDYVARFVADRHSLTVVDADAQSLSIRQMDASGDEIDRFQLTRT